MKNPIEQHARAGDRRTKRLCLLLAAVMFIGAATLSPQIHETRVTMLPDIEAELQGESPAMTLTASLFGSFKGILIITQWWRAMELQQDEKYFELDLLYRNICALEKRFPTVWSYAAWNLAYNISVKHHTGPDRWRWVNQGIEMLRDEGIRYNPGAAPLYYELSWIYSHKIGKYSDDYHLYYKAQLALQMERAMGQGYIEDLQPFIDAPKTLRELRQASDSASRLIGILERAGYTPNAVEASLDMLLDREDLYGAIVFLQAHRLRRAIPRDSMTREAFFEAASKHLDSGARRRLMDHRREFVRNNPSASATESYRQAANLLIQDIRRRLDDLFGPSEVDALTELAGTSAADDLLAFVRARYMREVLKLGGTAEQDLALLQYLRDRFGPLDWRMPDAHALHWAYLATRRARPDEFDANFYRVVLESLYQFMRGGQLFFNPDAAEPIERYLTYPDTRFYDTLKQYLNDVVDRDDDATAKERWRERLRDLYEEGVVVLYMDGNVEKAVGELREAARLWPDDEKFRADSVRQFALDRLAPQFLDVDYLRAQSTIGQFIRSQLIALALGNERRASGLEQFTRFAVERYMQQYPHHPIPAYDTLVRNVLYQLVYGDPRARLPDYLRENLLDTLNLPDRPPGENAQPMR